MGSLLIKLAWAVAGSLIARLLIGAGLTVVSYAAVIPLVQNALDSAASGWNGLPGDMVAILNLGGMGQVMSIIGTALLTRISLVAGLAGLARVSQQQGS